MSLHQITEDYVSFETAKLLKEKGFDGDCKYIQDPNNNPYSNSGALVSYPKPTLQMAMKWLREKGIIITIDYNEDEECEENERYGFSIYKNNKRLVDLATYVSYEEAAEAAIKYCLENLI